MNDEQPTIFVEHCPFRKDGSPVLGTSGASIGAVVVMTSETWKRLCAEIPQLSAMKFRVGTRSVR